MGFHICQFCRPGQENTYLHDSSGDLILEFSSGRKWQVPDIILHYMGDHGWLPPNAFVQDVMTEELTSGERIQTKGLGGGYFRYDPNAEPIGYLTDAFEPSEVNLHLVFKLEQLMLLVNREANYAHITYRVRD